MTVYNFILSILTGILLVFCFYYLFAVIFIHKKLFDKYFNFTISCLFFSFYVFFQLLLSLNWSDSTYYLLFHKLRLASIIIAFPFYCFLAFQCYFNEAKLYIVFMSFIVNGIFLIFSIFDLMITEPVSNIIINTKLTTFVYNFGKTTIFYSIWAIYISISLIITLMYYLLSKSKAKRIQFLIIFIGGLIAPINDWLSIYGYIKNISILEYFYTILIAFIFTELLREDQKTYISVLDLSKQLQKEKDESIRRLRITEIYTRRSLVEEIEKGNDPTKFKPESIKIATLFTDIRDFTGITEGLPPLETVDLLNSYFNRMNRTIIKHKGEIDKLMGDCIMALFKDPDEALKAAIEMRIELAKFNEPHPESLPLPSGGQGRGLDNGIGLNFGEVIIGNIGSESKMDYTVVGDIVNTASRLEALTKYYKVPLIISEDLLNQLCRDKTCLVSTTEYKIRFLDEVLVKGKSNPMKIYEVFDFEPPEIIEMKERNVKPLKEAFGYYQSGEFEKAIEIYKTVETQHAVSLQDTVLSFFIERCKNLKIRKDAGLLKDWNGVFEFMDK